jgi:hypothetical protein
LEVVEVVGSFVHGGLRSSVGGDISLYTVEQMYSTV